MKEDRCSRRSQVRGRETIGRGRQAWATSLGVGQLMEVVDTELEEVQVEVINEEIDDAYQIPLDED